MVKTGFLITATVGVVLIAVLGADGWNWVEYVSDSAPTNRSFVAAVWTGKDVIYWGGQVHDGNYQFLQTGYRYRPETRTWRPISTNGAPDARYLPSATWTGSEMILFGGLAASTHDLLVPGALYNPSTDSWRPMSKVNMPEGHVSHSAVWTGSEMIVWGGGSDLNSGGRYNPVTDTWTPITTLDAPTGRSGHAAVWTGSEMLIWGGNILRCKNFRCHYEYPADMGRLDPVSNHWVRLLSIPATPDLRADCSAVWDGTKMIVWGGYNGSTYGNRTQLQTGGRFDPVSGRWTPTSLTQAPSARDQHVTTWTGTEMIIWGGLPVNQSGGHYLPSSDTWLAAATTGAPVRLEVGTSVWTGEGMLAFTDRLYEYFETGVYAHDGIPDDWQKFYFGQGEPQGRSAADPDHDGRNNFQEFTADTDPTDIKSRLRVWCESVPQQGDQFRIGFAPHREGRTYVLGHAANLRSGRFTPVAGVSTNDDNGTRWITLPKTRNLSGFYQLQVSRP